MPYYDETGPLGAGPMTGRGMGPCGFGWFGRGRGFGRGLGRGLMSWFRPASKEEEKQDLDSYKKALKEELDRVEEEEKKL